MSQTTDTVCVPVARLRKLIKDNEKGKVASEQVVALTDQVAFAYHIIKGLQDRSLIEDSIISLLESNVKLKTEALDLSNSMIANLKSQTTVNQQWVQDLNKKYRREKRKRIVVTILGFLGTGAMTYFYLTK